MAEEADRPTNRQTDRQIDQQTDQFPIYTAPKYKKGTPFEVAEATDRPTDRPTN